MRISNILPPANRWFYGTPERALDQAYRAALRIKDLEDKYFNGQKVSPENTKYSSRAIAYFQSEVRSSLKIIRLRIAEFNLSRNILNITNISSRRYRQGSDIVVISDIQSSLIVDKLEVIEEVTSKYLTVSEPYPEKKETTPMAESMNNPRLPQGKSNQNIEPGMGQPGKKNVIPRSFFNTLNRIKQEIDPQSAGTEEEIIKQFRESRYQTSVSIRFILILIIIPLFVYQLSKVVIMPFMDNYFESREKIIFINQDLEREAMEELKEYEELLDFEVMIGFSKPIEPEEKEKKIQEKAKEISLDYQHKSMDAISNIFADTLSFISIILVLLTNKKELEIVKNFLSVLFYNLSDSAKAFILILSTDMFVGFHSPHGWEVLLSSLSRHLGLPENHDFNSLFIATFPVILDTVFKYWIFRYLNGLSPSSVATYKNMNE